MAIGAIVVAVGAQSAKPPPAVPPRDAGESRAALPEGHPPISLPEDIKQTIQKAAARAKQAPNDLDTWKQLGAMQYRAGQINAQYLAEAESTYEHILRIAPDDRDALRALGNIGYDRNRPADAIAFYERYLAVEPGDLSVQTDLGTMHLAAKDTDKALETYKKVLATDPSFFQAQFNLAIAYRVANEAEKALEALHRARDIAPDEKTKKHVEELLARVEQPGGDAATVADAPATGFRTKVEDIFRKHPIVGPKLDRVEWPNETTVKVAVREFPMEAMPPAVREMFADRIKNGLKESKTAHSVGDTVRVELVDSATGELMETFVE